MYPVLCFTAIGLAISSLIISIFCGLVYALTKMKKLDNKYLKMTLACAFVVYSITVLNTATIVIMGVV